MGLFACSVYSDQNNSFLGQHIDTVIASYGAPNAVVPLQSGGATYTWEEVKHYSKVYICKNNLTTNASGIVTFTSTGGDALMCS